MSKLSNELAVVLRKNGIKQTHVAGLAGVGTANISRIFTGTQEFVSTKHLDKIIPVVAKTAEDRAKLVRARLYDAYDGQYSHLVEIRIKGGSSPADRFTPNVSLSPDVKSALTFLAERSLSYPEVGEMLILQARALGME